MKKLVAAAIVSAAIGSFPLMAQDKKEMPMKEGMSMKGEEMKAGGMTMDKMKEMQARMAEMRKSMSVMMKGQGNDEERRHAGYGQNDASVFGNDGRHGEDDREWQDDTGRDGQHVKDDG